MPPLATIGLVVVVAYLLVGIKIASREVGWWPASTRQERRNRDEEFFHVMLGWPKVLWDDICEKCGW